jgi:hypothetical protein
MRSTHQPSGSHRRISRKGIGDHCISRIGNVGRVIAGLPLGIPGTEYNERAMPIAKSRMPPKNIAMEYLGGICLGLNSDQLIAPHIRLIVLL